MWIRYFLLDAAGDAGSLYPSTSKGKMTFSIPITSINLVTLIDPGYSPNIFMEIKIVLKVFIIKNKLFGLRL